jgi:hypothetical protein
MFLKTLKKNLDVANDGLYKHAKSQCKILNTLGYTKMTNVWIGEYIVNSSNYKTYQILLFLCSLQYK